MDCCGNTKQNTKASKEESMKGGKSMEIKKSTLMWIVIGILVIATLFLTFKASSIGAAQTTANVARTAASTASSGMVGGC